MEASRTSCAPLNTLKLVSAHGVGKDRQSSAYSTYFVTVPTTPKSAPQPWRAWVSVQERSVVGQEVVICLAVRLAWLSWAAAVPFEAWSDMGSSWVVCGKAYY